MKRLFLFFFLIFFFAYCNKVNTAKQINTVDYFLKFKVDGQTVEYHDFIFATRNILNNQHLFSIQGRKDNAANTPGLGLFFQDTSDFTEQSYIDGEISSANVLLYSDSSSVNFSSQYTTEPNELKIIITKVDSTSVRGIFSCKIADLDANNKTISEGEFCARIQ